jgi:carboxylesterase type B
MTEAKRLIDVLNDQANAAKLHALVEAQEQAKHDISNIADQVGVLGQQDTHNLLQSTTTTIITSQSQATGHAETVVVVPVTETSVTTHEHHTTTTQENKTAFGTVTG